MRRRQFIGLFVVATLCVVGCGKSLSDRIVGTWEFYEDDGTRAADGRAITLSSGGVGKLSPDIDLEWKQYPNMQYVTISFSADHGEMTMKLVTDDEASLNIAGAKQTLRRKK